MHHPGDIIDERYLLVKRLGVRAGAEMWEAEHEVVGRTVTVKFLPGNLETDPALHAVLVGEARAAVEIRHPAVVEVYDVGVTALGEAYLITEHLRGETLADVLARRGTLAPQDACRIAREVLAGLDAAHRAGVVHGGLRPDMIMLRREAPNRLVVKILDLRLANDAGNSADETPFDSATLEASVDRPTLWSKLGSHEAMTDAYTAPEQALGPSTDPRCDVFAVGMMLREMLTGSTATSEMPAPPLGNRPTDARACCSELPPKLDEVVRCATALVPLRRFESAREMANELEPFVSPDPALGVPLRESLMPLLSTEARRSRGMARLERAVLGMGAERHAPAPRGNVLVMDPGRRPTTRPPPAVVEPHVRDAGAERRAQADVCVLGSSLAAAAREEPEPTSDIKLPLPPLTPKSLAPAAPKPVRPSRHARDPRSLQRVRRRPASACRISHRTLGPTRIGPTRVGAALVGPASAPWWALTLLLLAAVCIGLLVARWLHL